MDPPFLSGRARERPALRRSAKYEKKLQKGWVTFWPLKVPRMLLLRGLKIDPTLLLWNKLLWIILLKVVGSTTYSNPTIYRCLLMILLIAS